MKLRYFVPILVALLAVFTGCNSDDEVRYLGNLKLSSSFVSLSKDGGSTQITLNASDSWSVQADDVPEWLTISPMSGGAGETKLTFAAEPAAGRTAVLRIVCGDNVQEVNVIQGIAEVSNATCAEVIAGADSKTYRVTGVCTAIANTNYGNWYLQDATGQIYIYGTVDASGKYNWASFGIEVGDVVTVQGPKTTYNGTVELVDVTVVKINKSLIKVEEVIYPNPEGSEILPNFLPKEGGEVFVALVNKGETLKVTIPEEYQSWLGISNLNGEYVTFKAAANEGGDRDATVTFGTTQGNKAYSTQLTITQKGAVIAATVAEFLAAEVGTIQYRLTGVISKDYPSDKQGQSFYIKDYTGEVLVYRTDNFKETALEIGDVCSVVGARGAYKDNPQMVNGTVEAVVEIVVEAEIPEVLAAKDGDWFRVTGTIKNIANPTYGNMTITDGTNDLFIYGVYPGYGATGDARKGAVEKYGLKEGDKITVFGEKGTNKGEPQIKNGVYWSHESAGEGGGEGGGEEPSATSVTFTQEQLAAAAAAGAVVKMNDYVSFTNSSDYGTTTVTELRVYADKVLEVKAAEGYVLNKIEFVCTANGDAKQGPGAWGTGAPEGYTFDAEGPNGKWEGTSATVSFTAVKQVRIKEMKVSFAKVD